LKILVAGGGGMIGSHLVDLHLSRGDSVIALDNFVTGRKGNLAHLVGHAGFRLVEADLLAPPASLSQVDVDLIYHLASPASPVQYGRRRVETLLVNSEGTKTLLDLAAANRARFVLASTSEIYGDPLVHPQPETYWGNVSSVGPRSCYDESKRFAESLTIAYGETRAVDVRIARIFNTYGPRSHPEDGRIIPNFVVAALMNEPLTVYGSGSQTRSFCFISDLVRGLYELGTRESLNGAIVNLGSRDERTVLEIAEIVRDAVGAESPIVHGPLPIGDPVQRLPVIDRAAELLDWAPSVPLAAGLEHTVAYFRTELADAAA
jgi:nucleoside-diphosphate-sugar epimerase